LNPESAPQAKDDALVSFKLYRNCDVKNGKTSKGRVLLLDHGRKPAAESFRDRIVDSNSGSALPLSYIFSKIDCGMP
jgi:hypothetical protein